MQTGSLLAIVLLTLVAIAHLARLATGIDITVGDYAVPQWVSGVGVAAPSLIAWMLWRESGDR